MTKTPMLSRRALLTGGAAAVAAAAVGTTAHAASAETVTGRFANEVAPTTGAGLGRKTLPRRLMALPSQGDVR